MNSNDCVDENHSYNTWRTFLNYFDFSFGICLFFRSASTTSGLAFCTNVRCWVSFQLKQGTLWDNQGLFWVVLFAKQYQNAVVVSIKNLSFEPQLWCCWQQKLWYNWYFLRLPVLDRIVSIEEYVFLLSVWICSLIVSLASAGFISRIPDSGDDFLQQGSISKTLLYLYSLQQEIALW